MRLHYALVILLMMLTGCDKLTGVTEQKTSDAEAIGYACRVSLKKPEDCMKDNDAQSTTSILAGWKAADKDIQEKKLDPSMGSDPATAVSIRAASAPGATGKATKGNDAASDKADASVKADASDKAATE